MLLIVPKAYTLRFFFFKKASQAWWHPRVISVQKQQPGGHSQNPKGREREDEGNVDELAPICWQAVAGSLLFCASIYYTVHLPLETASCWGEAHTLARHPQTIH